MMRLRSTMYRRSILPLRIQCASIKPAFAFHGFRSISEPIISPVFEQCMKPTLAIISTYKITCGIAGYSAHLMELLKDDFDVTVLPIDQTVVREGGEAAARHFDDIIGMGKKFDYVNIQFEYSLYGNAKNFQKLLAAFPRPSVTLHTVVRPETLSWKATAMDLVRLRIRQMLSTWLRNRVAARLFYPYKMIAAAQRSKTVPVFLHTRADAKEMRKRWKLKDVNDHPLCYVNEVQKREIYAEADISEFPRLQRLGNEVIIVGAFGFLSEYKGFDLAILALQKLPSNIHLAIFGGMHPNSHVPHAATPHYIQRLQQCTFDGFQGRRNNVDMSERVHFMGQPDDDAFLRAMALCHVVVVPYLEVGQSSSGPLSMAVDLGKKVIASRTKCFRAFGDYNSEQIRFCDIGNVLELAQVIEDLAHDPRPIPRPKYNADTNCAHYVRAITQVATDISFQQAPA